MGDQAFLWEPSKYVEFGDFRNRPFFDLTSRISASAPRTVVDLGCGPGNLTATLAQRWPGAQVIGLDSSAAMISQARMLAADGVSFVEGEIADWTPEESTDVVVSNAALQWVPEHVELMARWLAALRSGAWLGVQVPGNFGAPSHVLMRELAGRPRWRKQLDGVLRHEGAVAEPEEYYELFLRGGTRVDVWETTYHQLLSGENPVLEWLRGTGLRPVLAALGTESAAFEEEFEQLLAVAYPPGEFGTLFPFRRIFMVGEKQ